MIYRLDSASSKLADEFRNAPPAKRRLAALIASEIAVSSVGLNEPEVDTALDVLRNGATAKPVLREQVENLAARFDEGYFRLNEEGDETRRAEALQLFSKARAASALAFALLQDAAQLHEAIYEAIVALADPVELERSVGQALR